MQKRTSPDISVAVSYVAKFSAHPLQQHWNTVKRILWYVRGTTCFGLAFTLQETDQYVGFSDADWGGDQTDSKSMSGYLFVSVVVQ